MLVKIIICLAAGFAVRIFVTAAAAKVNVHAGRSHETVRLGNAERAVLQHFLHENAPYRKCHIGTASQRKCLEMNLSVFRTYPRFRQ